MTEPEGAPIANSEDFVFAIYPTGLMPGIILTSENRQKMQEAEDERERRRNDKRNPPKPPSRPNARIGGVALAEGL